jgi:small ligand-binding sensory domain FIST
MNTKIFSARSSADLLREVRQAVAAGLQPTLGVVFCSVALDIEATAAALAEFPFPFFACSSCGEIVTDTNRSATLEGSAVVALLELPPEVFQVRLFAGEGLDSLALGAAIGVWGKGVFAQPAFLVAISGLKRDGEQVVRGLLGQFPEEVPLFGGLAGDDAAFKETFTFTNGRATSDGAVVCVLDHERVEVTGLATSGWVALGAPKTVTHAEGNMLLTMDGQPALDVYKKYLDIKDEDLPGIGVEYPLQVLRDDGSHVLRAVLGVDHARRALIFAGTVPQGARVRFSSSPGFEAIDLVRRDFEAFPKLSATPALALFFSCMARHLALGPMVEDEIRAAQRVWNAPGIGFFTYGEIGRNLAGRCDFHNETFALAFLWLK